LAATWECSSGIMDNMRRAEHHDQLPFLWGQVLSTRRREAGAAEGICGPVFREDQVTTAYIQSSTPGTAGTARRERFCKPRSRCPRSHRQQPPLHPTCHDSCKAVAADKPRSSWQWVEITTFSMPAVWALGVQHKEPVVKPAAFVISAQANLSVSIPQPLRESHMRMQKNEPLISPKETALSTAHAKDG